MSILNYFFLCDPGQLLHYFFAANGMGLQRLCGELATRPQLKQMTFGLDASPLISSNRSALASTHRCPLCKPLQTGLFMQ